jgi:hypothetical protein
MANNYMNKCSTSLVIKEMQVKTILRFHLTPFRKTVINNRTINVGEDAGKKESLPTVDGNVN